MNANSSDPTRGVGCASGLALVGNPLTNPHEREVGKFVDVADRRLWPASGQTWTYVLLTRSGLVIVGPNGAILESCRLMPANMWMVENF